MQTRGGGELAQSLLVLKGPSAARVSLRCRRPAPLPALLDSPRAPWCVSFAVPRVCRAL